MASPFAKYQSEQVQQIAPGFIEGFAKSGAAIGQGLAAIGQAAVQGYEEAEKKNKEQIATKAALAPYIKNDQRVQVVEGLFKAGILTKAADGTAVVAADYAGKVDMAALDKNLSFYNTTGGDGSKLSGNALIEFTARLQSEQKYVADQAGRAKAKLDLELQQAQIDELKSKSGERAANAGAYGAAIFATLGGSPSVSAGLPSITLPDTSTPNVITGTPVTKADTNVPAAAAPAAISPALTAGTAAKQSANEVAVETGAAPEPKISAALAAGTTPAAPKQPAPAAQAPAAQAPAAVDYGDRVDGTKKGTGFLGEIKLPDGRVATEVSVGVNINGKDVEIPTLVPTLTSEQKSFIANGGDPRTRPDIIRAATEHASKRIADGKSPFNEQTKPLAAPVTEGQAQVYDVPAKSAEVATKLKAIEDKRTAVRTKYTNTRRATEGEIAVANANLLSKVRPNEVGLKLADATRAYNVIRLKSVDEAEAREMKALDSEVAFIKTDFTNYQANATAARQVRTEDRLQRQEIREIKKEEAALTLAEEEFVAKLSKNYPMIGVYTYRGYNLKDPKTGKLVNPAIAAKVAPMPTEQYTEATEQNKGYGSAKNFLLNMSDILRDREKGGDEYAYLERFRYTAKNMENYFKAEQASVFGVATFRKVIVSGGNFSDADREFVRQAITYLNSGAVDMTNKDLRASLNALTFMVDGMYRVNLEELGMTYNKEAALEKATALRAGGDEAGAAGVDRQVKTTERFNKTFNLQQDKASSISKEKIAEARASMQKGFKGFKFVPPTEESK